MGTGNFYLHPIYNEPISSVTATPSVQLGAIRVEAGEEYIYLYNGGGANSTQASVGQGCILTASSGYTITISSVTNIGAYIAVVKHATCAAASYFWGLTRGFSTVQACTSTAHVAGAPIGVGLNGTWAPIVGSLTCPIQGIPMIDTAAAGAGFAYVRCFGS